MVNDIYRSDDGNNHSPKKFEVNRDSLQKKSIEPLRRISQTNTYHLTPLSETYQPAGNEKGLGGQKDENFSSGLSYDAWKNPEWLKQFDFPMGQNDKVKVIPLEIINAVPPSQSDVSSTWNFLPENIASRAQDLGAAARDRVTSMLKVFFNCIDDNSDEEDTSLTGTNNKKKYSESTRLSEDEKNYPLYQEYKRRSIQLEEQDIDTVTIPANAFIKGGHLWHDGRPAVIENQYQEFLKQEEERNRNQNTIEKQNIWDEETSSDIGSEITVVVEEVVVQKDANQEQSLQTSEKETEAGRLQREAAEKKRIEAEETRIRTEIKNKLLSWVEEVKRVFVETDPLCREDNYPPYQEFTAALQSFQHGKDLVLLSGKPFSKNEKNEEISKATNRRKNFPEKVAKNEMFKLYINRMEACVEAGKNMQEKGDTAALEDPETAKTCFHLEIEKQAKNNARGRNWLAKNFKSLGEAAPSIEGGKTIDEIMLKSDYKDIWKYIQKSCENEGITCEIDKQKQFRDQIVNIKDTITKSGAEHKELLTHAIDAYNAVRQAELAIQKTIRDEVKRGTELRKQGQQYNLPFTDDQTGQDTSPSRMVKYRPTEGKGHIQEILDANAKSKKTKDRNQSGMNKFVNKLGDMLK